MRELLLESVTEPMLGSRPVTINATPFTRQASAVNTLIMEQRQIGDLITLIQSRLDFVNRKP